MVAFLYDLKRGHCEYFAGAMALMCQSLGMQARVVTGFKCDEYNDVQRLLHRPPVPRPRLGRGEDRRRLEDLRPDQRQRGRQTTAR